MGPRRFKAGNPTSRYAARDHRHAVPLTSQPSWERVKRSLRAAKTGLLAKTLEIEKLKLQIDRLRRVQFGRSSEKIARTIEQLELRLEDLEA